MSKVKQKFMLTPIRIIGVICTICFILFLALSRSLQLDVTDGKSLNKQVSHMVTQPFELLHNFTNKYFTFNPSPSDQLKNAYIQLKQEYTELKQEHEKLSDLLKYTPDNVINIGTGRIISSPNGLFSKTLHINIGENEGIKKDDIAITKEGLVGRIIAVNKNSADIMPINHAASKIIGVEASTGVKLLISGRYQMHMVAEYVTDPLLLKKNMIIRTLSDGRTIPFNIPIGKIIDPHTKPVHIKLAVNFKNLHYVRIVRFRRDGVINADTSPDLSLDTDRLQ